MNLSDCQTATDATAFAGQYEERQSVLDSLSYRVAMELPADKVKRQKRLQNRAKDRQKKFAF